MRHPSRIKVSDLLLHVGQTDTIVIEKFSLNLVDNLDLDGVSWELHLQSIDNFTVIATLEKVSCVINDVSDISGVSYKRPVFVDSFMAYFVMSSHDFVSHDEEDSPIFPIDEKNETIDISEMIYQSIVLQEPFVKRTPDEELLYSNVDMDEEDFDDTGIWWTIVFRK